jgi:hypothetical protein
MTTGRKGDLMADEGRIELERAGDGERWRVRHAGGDVEGHAFRAGKFAVEGEDAEGHAMRGKLSLEPDGEDEGGEPLFRIGAGGDLEGHLARGRGAFTLEPTGEEQGGDPVYRMLFDGDDAEGHLARSGR